MRYRGSVRSLTESHRAALTRPDHRIFLSQSRRPAVAARFFRRRSQLPSAVADSPTVFPICRTTSRTCQSTSRTCQPISRSCRIVSPTCRRRSRSCRSILLTCQTISRSYRSISRTCRGISRTCQTAFSIWNGLFSSYLHGIPAKRRKSHPSGISRQTLTLIKNYENCHLDSRRPGNVLGKSQFTLGFAILSPRAGRSRLRAPFPANSNHQ